MTNELPVWPEISRDAFDSLDLMIRSGPQHVDGACHQAWIIELQRVHAIFVAQLGDEWHAFHTDVGFRLWEHGRKQR